ncbi:MAG: FAD:protein FMN transferase [Owenweeksia sp. TMED14]|nr:MAG: FAD:protein FMN transferase [Owenweeksia sp. TMED14]
MYFVFEMLRYIILVFVFCLGISCSNEESYMNVFEGKAQGTSFHITLYYNQDFSGDQINQNDIERWLSHYNRVASPWDPNSEISKLNMGDSVFLSSELFELCHLSHKMKISTDGVLDPTLGDLINGWGFGVSEGFLEYTDTVKVDSLMKYVGDESWIPFQISNWAWPQNVKLNFMSLSQGHSVDIIIDSLKSKGVDAAFVEVGGEIRTFGTKPNEDVFTVGIERPLLENSGEFQVIIPIKNQALATSGNYRNYKFDISTGGKYGHTISSFTGWPIETDIISATIIGPTCAEADAMATASMAMGFGETRSWLAKHPKWNAYILFKDENGSLNEWTTLNNLN